MQMTVGQRIKKLMRELGMTQEAFATSLKAGINQSKISRIIKANEIEDLIVDRICKVHGVSENWIKTGEGAMFLPGENIAPVKTEVEFLREIVASQAQSIADLSMSNKTASGTIEKTLKEILSLLRSGEPSTAKSEAHA
jgi:transcriptional regulator with XRE-family HTH domain